MSNRWKYGPEYHGRTALYRLYDETGRLLYAGVSGDPEARWYQHELEKFWWHQVTRKDVVWLDTRAEARAAESEAIRTEKPLYDRSNRRARLPEREALDLQREHTAQAVAAMERDIRAGEYPLYSVLPSRPALADRYSLPFTAIASALWDLRTAGLVTLNRAHWVVQNYREFPGALERKYGLVYVLGVQIFGEQRFTMMEMQQRTRLSANLVSKQLNELRRAGMAEADGWSRSTGQWALLPQAGE